MALAVALPARKRFCAHALSVTSASQGLHLTENGAPAFESSGAACLDFFFQAVPGCDRDSLYGLLRKAWDEDPLSTTKLILQLGDPRMGKSDRDNHQLSLLWLWRHFPDTTLANLRSGALEQHTCLKGLLDLLMYAAWDDEDFVEKDLEEFPRRGTTGPQRAALKTSRVFCRRESKETQLERRQRRDADRRARVEDFVELKRKQGLKRSEIRVARSWRDSTLPGRMPWIETEEWASEEIKRGFSEYCHEVDHARNALRSREAKLRRDQQLEKVKRRYATDPRLAELYDAVAQRFADGLAELVRLRRKELKGELPREEARKLRGSLYPKWAPTKDGMHDKRCDIVRGIVERLFPEKENRLADGTYEEYLSFMTDRYRREVLSPLRRRSHVPEACVGAQDWGSVDLDGMPARCRLLFGQSVWAPRVPGYAEHLQRGNVHGGVQPHELVTRAAEATEDAQDAQEVEAMWRDLVRDVQAKGSLGRSVPLCDVSGSMHGQPMEVAVALSLLLSELADEPWRDRICTFSEQPQFISVEGTSLKERAESIKRMDWGMNTNFELVFEQLLQIALEHEVSGEQMPELLVVFSDMQFDESQMHMTMEPWATTHENIEKKFRLAGYGDHIPQIVYWNLRRSQAKGRYPVQMAAENVVMLSGFSQGLLKSFLAGKLEVPTPMEQMRAILDSSYYDDVVLASEDRFSKAPKPHLSDLLFH